MDVIKLVVVALAGWINQQQEDVIDYHRERHHQGLENKIIEPEFGSAAEGEMNCRERLGGLLRYYYRDAA
jgi:hypothetical protein